MLLLALDTSAAAGAALHDGTSVVALRSVHDPRRHAEVLMPFVREVLAEVGASPADLTAVAAGVGPGPFTGLRVGLVTARTLGHALGIDVHGVGSLDALAAQAFDQLDDDELVVATDARRREVYWARYRRSGGGFSRVDGPHVGAASSVPVHGTTCVGRGALLYRDALPGPDLELLDPSPGALAGLAARSLTGRGDWLVPPDPLYLRRPDATEPGARKRVRT